MFSLYTENFGAKVEDKLKKTCRFNADLISSGLPPKAARPSF